MILITGATGFLGREVVKRILFQYPNRKIIGLYHQRRNKATLRRMSPAVEWIQADLALERDLKKLPAKVSVLVHLASFVPQGTDQLFDGRNFEGNVKATWNLAVWCRQSATLQHVIYSSSVSVYGRSSHPLSEEDPRVPEHFYGLSKWLGEQILSSVCRPQHIRFTALRYSSIYGEGQRPRTVLPFFISRCRAGHHLTLYGKGERCQDFIYVKDAARAVLLAYKKKAEGIYNIGSGTSTTMRRLAQAVQKHFPSSSKIIFKNVKETAPNLVLNIQKAKRKLGYVPSYSLDQGLREYAEAFKSKGRVND